MNFRITIPDKSYRSFARGIGLHGVLLKFTILMFLCLLSQNLFSQETVSGVPLSIIHNLSEVENYEVMPDYSQIRKTKKADQGSDRLKRLEFAHVFDLSLSPQNSGEWITLDNGDRIWRIGLASKGAYSLNLIFGIFHLEADVKIYVYTPDQKNILGAYSSLNNNSAGTLAIEPLTGDSLVVEINIPALVLDYGEIVITKLGHDFMNIFGTSYKSLTGTAVSGACNVDINCDEGLEWQREKYAVCKLIINARDLCTGTLINNTARDKTPYIVTAHHCIDTIVKAASTVFIFEYEKWKCKGQDGPKPVTLSGSQLIATTPNLDFSLVKINSLPPFRVKPYFVGWDRSGNQPLRTVTIHHPDGDFKKISKDDNPAVTSTFEEDYNPSTHWLINKWELGTTERGSSGGPLFNQNHLFVGSLTGGDATCASPVKDYFAKFSNSWADYSDWKRQLKHWLDPLNSDSLRITGLDPYVAEKASCDTIRNISTNETLRLYNTNLSWGSYSGHNSQLYTQFAEKIDISDTLKIPGFYLHVAKAYNASPLSYITIKIWKGGIVPGDEISSSTIYLRDLTVNRNNYLEFDSTLYVKGPVYLGYEVNYPATRDTFALYQSQDRGVTGFSGMMVYKDGIWSNISKVTSPSIYSSLDVGLISCSLLDPFPKKLPSSKLIVYPNPVSSGTLFAELPSVENVVVSVYDLTGRKSRVDWKVDENRLVINTSGLNSGIYILKVMIPGKGTHNAKFMVLK